MPASKPLVFTLNAAICGALLLITTEPGHSQTPASSNPPPSFSSKQRLFSSSHDAIEIKFRKGSQIRLRNGQLNVLSGSSKNNLSTLRCMQAPDGPIAHIKPLFSGSEAELAALAPRQQLKTAHDAPDLNQWFSIRLKPGSNLQRVIEALKAMPEVETAYPAPKPAPLPSATPDLTGFQTYGHSPEFYGTDATYAKTVAGGRGENVRVLDIEYGWNRQHEDLTKLRRPEVLVPLGIGTTFYSDDDDHGTAVMGEIGSDDNAFGVTGLVPDTELRLGSPLYMENNDDNVLYNPAAAVIAATRALRPGDVILLEQQYQSGCSAPGIDDFVPIEVIPSVYDAIVTATANGIHVVQAAGNGGVNLDTSCAVQGGFPFGKPDSGSIIVGASYAKSGTPLSRTYFSTYGARVNLQAWGDWSVTTTGVGPIGEPDHNRLYTHGFSGTSSASPIVASAVAAISSIGKERGILLTPKQMRDVLVATGTPQANPETGHIGPLPNLRAAIARIGGQPLCPALAGTQKTKQVDAKDLAHSYQLRMGRPGVINACLQGTTGGNFDLHLERRTDNNRWETVAEATSLTASEPLSHHADAGLYRFRVVAPESTGTYRFGFETRFPSATRR